MSEKIQRKRLLIDNVHQFQNHFGKNEYQVFLKDEKSGLYFTFTTSMKKVEKLSRKDGVVVSFNVVGHSSDWDADRIKVVDFE